MTDWAPATPGFFLFCAALAFSRRRFVGFATDHRASTTLATKSGSGAYRVVETSAAARGKP
jgi:hypothetical protein